MAIEARDITKRFGDYVALDDVSVHVPDGSLTALLGPSRQRQEHASARDRRARDARLGHRADRGRGHHAVDRCARAGWASCFQHYAAFKHMTVRRQRRLRPDDPQAAEGRERRAGGGAARTCRARRRLGGPLPLAALGRPAPADGARPRARGRAARAAARRAVRRARRPRARGAARMAAPPPRRGPRDDDLRHARPGGGDGDRRADRRRQRRPDRAVRVARADLRRAREPVRDGVRRPGHADGRPARATARRAGADRAGGADPAGGGEADRPLGIRGARGAAAHRGGRADRAALARPSSINSSSSEGQLVHVRVDPTGAPREPASA